MINSIRIKNFQSHKDSYLEFSPGINILVGQSNSGKTSIFRGWNWASNNKPSGDSFRSNFGGDTEVLIEVDGYIICRTKTDKDNSYLLITEKQEIPFRSFGQDVPEEIKRIINMDDVNFQYQMDSPFLLSKSSGEVAKYLNKIIKLDDIDISISNILSESRENKQNIKFQESQLKKLKENEEGLCWIESADIKLKEAEDLEKQINQLQNDKLELTLLINSINRLNEEIFVVDDVLKARRQVKIAESLDSDIKEKKKEIDDLYSIVNQMKNIAHRKTVLDKIIDAKDDVDEADKMLLDIDKLNTSISKSNIDLNEFNLLRRKYDRLNNELNELRKEFDELMPNVCPLCEQEVKGGEIHV